MAVFKSNVNILQNKLADTVDHNLGKLVTKVEVGIIPAQGCQVRSNPWQKLCPRVGLEPILHADYMNNT